MRSLIRRLTRNKTEPKPPITLPLHEPVAVPPTFDTPQLFNKVQFDQVYLYKYALMIACQRIVGLEPNRKFQDVFDWAVEEAGAYIIKVNDHEKLTKEK